MVLFVYHALGKGAGGDISGVKGGGGGIFGICGGAFGVCMLLLCLCTRSGVILCLSTSVCLGIY